MEKVLRLAHLQVDIALKQAQRPNQDADTAPKQAQIKYEAAKVVISAITAGAALAGGLIAGTIALLRTWP